VEEAMTIRIEPVRFESGGAPIAGVLYTPSGDGPWPGVVLDGPLTSVKEQAVANYGRALAERGFAALAYDHRYFGASGGEPRQYESPRAKIEDAKNARTFLATRREVARDRIAAVGVCAGGGYMAGAVAEDRGFAAFGAVAGFFHDAAKQREWMGDAGYEAALTEAKAARAKYEATGVAETIPAVGRAGERVAMPLAEALEYYGTPRGAIGGYVNAFAVLSRADTLPYDAQGAAARIEVPTTIIHSEHALAPPLARKFYDALVVRKSAAWLESKGQIDFYDDPALVARACDLLAEWFTASGLRAS
jgi:fermentation-respiration switch protein FrsA (DUF1100 family)